MTEFDVSKKNKHKRSTTIGFIVIICIVCIMCLGLGSVLFFKTQNKIIYADKNGLVAGDISAAKKNRDSLEALFKKSKNFASTEIHFSKGIYYFNTSEGGLKCTGVENLSLVGDETLFVNTSYDNSVIEDYFSTSLLLVENVKNINIQNISFDYKDYTSLNGTVVSVTDDSITLKLDEEFLKDGYHNSIQGGELVSAVNEISIDGKSYLGDYYLKNIGVLELNRDDATVVLNNFQNNIKVGNTAVLRFGVGGKIPSFMISNTTGFSMENVNVYSSPCAVIYSTHGSSDFAFDGLNIAPHEQSKMLYSANIDGVHLKNFSGTVNIQNCVFKGMGDDAFNSNSRALRVTAVDDKKLTVECGYEAEAIPSGWAKAGDILNVYNIDWECVGQAIVKSYTDDCITTDNEIIKSFENCYLENTRYLPQINIENTVVDLSRARGFILRSKNITIRNCTIKNTALSAIIASPDISKWYEMSPSEQVLIEDCTFDNCATLASSNSGGIITFKYADDDLRQYAPKIHKNVIIRNNTFVNHWVYAVYAMGVDGITIENNTYENHNLAVKTINCENKD